MSMDIFNSKPRKIKCVSKREDGMMVSSTNHHLLEVGKEYTLTHVEVNNWYTLVWVEEIPEVSFNSVVFEEVETEDQG